MKLEYINDAILREIINNQLKSLNEILNLGDLTDQKLNNLLIQYEKDKALFDRKIKELKER